MGKKGDSILASLLPEDTEIWIDGNDDFSVKTVGEVLQEIKDSSSDEDIENIKNVEYYIKDLVDFPQPYFKPSEHISECMDEECFEWSDKNESSLIELDKVFEIVYNMWRDRIDHTIYGRGTMVIFK